MSQVIAPRLSHTNNQFQPGIDLVGYPRDLDRQPQKLMLAQRQDRRAVAGAGQMPAADASAIALQGRDDITEHELGKACQVPLPQLEPVGQLRRREIDQRTAGHCQSFTLGPVQERVLLAPVVAILAPLDATPGKFQADAIEGAGEQAGRLTGGDGSDAAAPCGFQAQGAVAGEAA